MRKYHPLSFINSNIIGQFVPQRQGFDLTITLSNTLKFLRGLKIIMKGVMVEQLNYALFNQKRPKNKPDLMQYAKNPKDFRRIARPAYMPAYSSGYLFQGKMLENAHRRDTTFFHITSYGYVEYRKYASGAQYKFNDKPTHQAKIQRTKVHGNTRELFLNKRISDLSFKKVKYQGKTQYRLNVVNMHKPFLTEGQSDDDIPSVYYSRYLVGGKKCTQKLLTRN